MKRKRKLKTYKVESYSRWYLVKAYNKKSAHKDACQEWGTGMVKNITEASESEIEYFTRVKGSSIDEAEEC